MSQCFRPKLLKLFGTVEFAWKKTRNRSAMDLSILEDLQNVVVHWSERVLDATRESLKDFPSYEDMLAEASTYRLEVQNGLLQATDPDYKYWETLPGPPSFFILGLSIFWLFCWALGATTKHGINAEDLYGFILTYQLTAFAINIVIFLTPFLVWHGQGRFIRTIAIGLESLPNVGGMAWLLNIYVVFQLAYFLHTMVYMVKEGEYVRGRTIQGFHETLKPIKAWTNVRFNPGGPYTMFVLADLSFGFACNYFCVMERIYKNVFPESLERMGRFLCAMEAIMHAIALARLLYVTYTMDIHWSTPYIAWSIFHCILSPILLLIVLGSMFYADKLKQNFTECSGCRMKIE